MGTRATIGVVTPEGQVLEVLLNYDGYVSYAGSMLVNYYNTQDLALKLVAGGDISTLSKTADLLPGHTFEERHPDCTTYYGRDRGESGVDAAVYNSIEEYMSVFNDPEAFHEFSYLWVDNSWHVTGTTAKTSSVFDFLNSFELVTDLLKKLS